MPRVPSQKRRPAILASSVAAMLSISLLLGSQRAKADEYYDGTNTGGSGTALGSGATTGATNVWDNSTTNWVDASGQFPAVYDPNTNAVFGTNGGTVTLGDNISFSSLHFTANGYDVAGGGFTLTATGGGTITVDGGISTTIDAQLTGSNLVDFEGGGTVTVNSTANDYSGGTSIGNGTTLVISSDANLGNPNGSVTMNGGTLRNTSNISTARAFVLNAGGGSFAPDPGITLAVTGQISGTGALTINGAGIVSLQNSGNNYLGGTTLINGTLQVSADGDLGDPTGAINFNGGSLETTATFTSSRAVNLNVSIGSINADSSTTLTLNGVVGGSGGLTVNGTGTVVLGNAGNTYLGGTKISAGTLSVSADGNLGDQSGGVNFNGGTLEATQSFTTARTLTLTTTGSISPDSGITVTLAGQITGGGALNVDGNGVVLITGTTNNYTGATVVTSGTLRAGAVNVIPSGLSGSPVTVSAGAIFDLQSADQTQSFDQTISSLSGAGTVSLGTATLTVGGNNNDTSFTGSITGAGNLTKEGTGTLALGATNSYTGTTLISSGTLSTTVTNALSSSTSVNIASGANFTLNGFNQSVGSLTGAGTVNLGNAVLTVGSNNSNTSFSGSINGTGGLTKTGLGTLTITGTNSYTGNTTVSRGTLEISPTSSTALLSNSSRLVLGGTTADGGTFQLDGVAGMTTKQVMNGLTVNSSQNQIIVNNLGTATTLDLRGTSGTAGITHNGGSVDFAAATGNLTNTSASGASVQTAQANDSTGILGGWATINHGADLASKDANGYIVAFTGYHDIAARGDVVPNQPTWNVRINSAGTTGNDTLAAKTTNINTLTQNTATASTIDTTGGTLRLGADGGILITSAGGNLTIGATANAGTLTSGGSTANTAGTLNLNNSSPTAVLTVNSTIANNGTGVVSVVIAGTGITVFDGNNTYTGSTSVSAGTLQIGADNSLPGTTAVSVNTAATLDVNSHTLTIGSLASGGSGGGTVSLTTGTLNIGQNNTNTAYGGAITVTGAGAVNKIGTGTQTLSGSINGAGTVTLKDSGSLNIFGTITGSTSVVQSGTGTLTISNTGNSYTGGTTLNSGRLNVNGSTTDGSGSPLGTGTLTINGGTLGTTVEPSSVATTTGTVLTNPISVKGDFSIATNSDASNPVSNQNLTLSGGVNLNGSTRAITGTIDGGQVHFGGAISNGGLTLNSAFTTTGNYSAFVFDAGNVNSYTGDTTVNAGVLLELKGSTTNGAIQGNLDIKDNGVVWYGNGNTSAGQISDTSTVTVDSTGNTIALAGGVHLDGLELGNASETIGTLNGKGTVGLGSGTLTVANGNFTGVIEDGTLGSGGNLVKATDGTASGGTLILSGANTYTGTTTISAGTLQDGINNAIPVTSVVTLMAGANLNLNGFNQQVASISGGGNIQLGSGTSASTLTEGSNNASTALSGNITGAGGLTKVGTGTLTLTGANTYSGSTTITNGTLKITPAGTTPVLGSSTGLVLGGASANNTSTFELDGISGTNTTQIVNGLTIGTGNNVIVINTPAGTTTTLDLRGPNGPTGTVGIARSAGFIDFRASGGGVFGTDAIVLTNQANGPGGILGAWATVNNGSDLATVQGGKIVGLSTVAGGYTDIGATFDIVPNGSDLNVRINKPAGSTSTSNDIIATQPVTSINTLTQNNSTASTVSLGGGTLQVGSDGGILITPTGGNLTIGATANDGVLTAGTGTAPSTITLANNSSNVLTINSAIRDNVQDKTTTPVSVRLTGSGVTVFDGTNTYTGTTSILNGTLQTNSNNALGNNSAVTINSGATLSLNNTTQVVGSIANGPNGAGAIGFGSSGGSLTTGGDNTSTTFSGVISGAGSITKTGTGILTLAGNSTYTGGTTLTNGGFITNANAALGTGTLTIAPGTGNTVSIGSTVNSITLSNAVSVKGNFSVSTAGFGEDFTLNGAVNLNGATRTITGVTDGGQVHFGGAIGVAGETAGVNFNTSFTKTGDYVAFIFDNSNSNNYTGLTTVNNGAFLVLEGSTQDGAIKGNLTIQGNGVVDYLGTAAGGSSVTGQIADTATVTVNSGGNTASGTYFGGLDFFNATSETIATLNGNKNGVVALGAANLTLNDGNFAGTIFDGTHTDPNTGLPVDRGGQLTKVGTGTLILSGQTAYTGATNLNGGTIQANADFVLSSSSAFKISSGATLDLNSHTQQVGSIADGASGSGTISLGSGILETGFDGTATTFSGVIQDGGISKGKGGGIIEAGQTTGTLTLSGANTYTGVTGVDSGTLIAGAVNTIPLKSQVSLSSGGTFNLNNNSQSVGSLSNLFSAGGTINLGTATLTIGNDNLGAFFTGTINGTGGLTKVGTGIQFINGINTYTGATNVNKGTLGLTSESSLASAVTVNNSAIFDNAGSVSIAGSPAATVTGSEGRVVNEFSGLLSSDKGVVVTNTSGISYVINFGTITGTAGGAANVAVDASTSAGVVIGDFGRFNGAVKLNPAGINTVILATQYLTQGANIVSGSTGPNDTLELAGSSVDTLNLGKPQNFEYLHKVGGGMWTLTGTGDFTGGTVISGGTINLQGNLLSAVRVESGGSLAGTGNVQGSVTNFGVVLPGTPSDAFTSSAKPGTLSVRNNYTQGSQGVLVIQANGSGAGQYSQITIGGRAQLNGGLAVVQNGSGPRLKYGQQLTFLTAAAGVSGRFSEVSLPALTIDDTVVIPKVVYEGNSVALQGSQGSFSAIQGLVNLTYNQSSVAQALDSGLNNKGNQKLLRYLDTQTIANLPSQFDKIAPEEVASVFRIGVSLADVQAHNIQRRTADLRNGATGFDASEFQTTGGANYTGGLAGATGPTGAEGKNVNPQAPDQRWGAFIKGVGDFAHVGDTGNARGYDMNTGGVTVGADYRLSNRLAVGVTAGYTGTDAKLTDNGHVLVNGGKTGVYGTYFDKGFYADAGATVGVNNYTTRRASVQGDAYGHTDGAEVDLMVDTGYDWRLDALTIGPTASFQYTYLGIDGFTEHGSLAPLRYESQHQDSIRSTIGMHVSYDYKIGKVIVRPEGMLAWQHEYGDRSYAISSTLAGGSNVFSVSDPQVGRDSLQLSAGVSVLWNPRTSTFVYYDADLLKKEYDSQGVTGGLRMNF